MNIVCGWLVTCAQQEKIGNLIENKIKTTPTLLPVMFKSVPEGLDLARAFNLYVSGGIIVALELECIYFG